MLSLHELKAKREDNYNTYLCERSAYLADNLLKLSNLQMASNQTNYDPYNNFQALNTNGSPPPYSAYPTLSGVSAEQPPTEKSGSGEPALSQNLNQLEGWYQGCCWNGLKLWKKTFIIVILLLIVVGLGIVVVRGSTFSTEAQYVSLMMIPHAQTTQTR